MKDMDNPFMEETGDLFTLDTTIIELWRLPLSLSAAGKDIFSC
jgi:hypothetical protein